ncbi:MAG: hypothetical protein WCJ39_03625 [bacterium]
MDYNLHVFIFLHSIMVKKIIEAVDQGTPHKDRLVLTLLWAIFAFTVVNSALTIAMAQIG